MGKLNLGMSRAELDAVGLAVEPGFTKAVFEVGGTYRVVFRDETIEQISIELDQAPRDCLTVRGETLDTNQELAEVAAAFAGCAEPSLRVGGRLIECESGVIHLKVGSARDSGLVLALRVPRASR